MFKRSWALIAAALVASVALVAPGTARADETAPQPMANGWCENAPLPYNMALRPDNGLPYYTTAPYEPKDVYNPNSIANFIKNVSRDGRLTAKQRMCYLELGGNHLIDGSHTEGTGEDTLRWFGYRFDFSAHPSIPKLKGDGDGWFSGLAQGGVLAAFVELDKHTKDPKWMEYGEQAFRSFDVPMDKKTGKGGITNHITVDGKDVLWFEEYPTAPATSVLNGHLEALIGLDIWFDATGDQHAKDLVDEALDGLEPVLEQESIDVQGGTLTSYDLMRGYWDKDRDYEASPLRLVSASATRPTAFLNGDPVDIPVVKESGTKAAPEVQARDGDVYTTPGYHTVNGRQWHTACEKYSTNVDRCRAEIRATQVQFVGGKYQEVTGWYFNNLTYKPSPRAQWEGNPLAANGVVGGKHSWTSTEGRQWKTECDTAETGRNGCRSYIMSKDIVVKTVTPRTYERVDRWVFNNIVQFSQPTGIPILTHDPHMNGPILANSSQPQKGWQQVVSGSKAVLDRGRVKVTTDGKGWQGVSQIIPASKITGKRLALSLNAELITPGNGTKKGVPGKVAVYQQCPGSPSELVFESQKMRSRQKTDYTMSFLPRNTGCNLLLQLMTASYGDVGTTIYYDNVELREADDVGPKFDLSTKKEPFKHLDQFVYDRPTNELTIGGNGTVEVQMYEDGRWQRLGKQRLTPGQSFSVEIPERITGRNIHYGYHEHHVDELISLYNRTKQDMDKDNGSKDREFLRTYALEWVKMAPSRIGKVPARYLPDSKARTSVDDPGDTYDLPIVDPFALLEDEWASPEDEALNVEGDDLSSIEQDE